jgi:hypothetical protein
MKLQPAGRASAVVSATVPLYSLCSVIELQGGLMRYAKLRFAAVVFAIIGISPPIPVQAADSGPAPRAPKGLKLPPQQMPPSNRWLGDADNDADRFRKIEIFARGFDHTMWEVGERYKRTYDAIWDRNWELADYHWDKIRVTINVGLMKRPMRTQNSEGMFLDGPWKQMDEAIKSRDYDRMQKQFMATRQVCMACHAAERVPFMNDQPVFKELVFAK